MPQCEVCLCPGDLGTESGYFIGDFGKGLQHLLWLCWLEFNGRYVSPGKDGRCLMWFPTEFHQGNPKDKLWGHPTAARSPVLLRGVLVFPIEQARIWTAKETLAWLLRWAMPYMEPTGLATSNPDSPWDASCIGLVKGSPSEGEAAMTEEASQDSLFRTPERMAGGPPSSRERTIRCIVFCMRQMLVLSGHRICHPAGVCRGALGLQGAMWQCCVTPDA